MKGSESIMSEVIKIMMWISDFIWGWPLLISISCTALFLSKRLRFFQFTKFCYIIRSTLGNSFSISKGRGNISPLQACCTALASTLGVGNIAGVSMAIAIGGPGAVFWMWLVALMGLIVKFSEITLGVAYREEDLDTHIYHGGFYWYVKQGLGEKWKWMGLLWAILLGCAMLFAPAVQINSVVGAINSSYNVNPLMIGVLFAVLMAIVLVGGVKRIAHFAVLVVPTLTIIYIGVCTFVLIKYASSIPSTIIMIMRYAFTPASASGGFTGATILMTIRWGLARGTYSNEAGTGMAPLAHSSARVIHPVQQGMWGIVEVFLDTMVICTLTALVILCSGVWDSGLSGAALTACAFGNAFGSQLVGTIFVTVIIAFLSFTTALINVYYGEICVSILNGRRFILIYRILGCMFAVIGAIGALNTLWNLFDFFFGLCTLLNLYVLLLMHKQIYSLVREYMEHYHQKK
ncbi:amino acid carrier protein [Enterocloster clostridioformis]